MASTFSARAVMKGLRTFSFNWSEKILRFNPERSTLKLMLEA
ncbi:MAG: hypothetical protein QXH67_07150 [Candidatus Bathyarchaeia archaeon]